VCTTLAGKSRGISASCWKAETDRWDDVIILTSQ
jgi:hypothetical protein